MAQQEEQNEIGSPYDWTEFYWGGFQPAMIGAVPLLDAFSKDESSKINEILSETREKLKGALENEKQMKLNEYFVTIHDEYEDEENQSKYDIVHKDKDKKRNEITVVRLWHKNVFIGVRGAGKANPGQLNFLAKFYAKSGQFVSFEKWEE